MWVEGGGVGGAFRHLKEWVGSRSLTPDGRRKPSTGVQDVRPVPARVEPWTARPSQLLREYVADCERALSRPEAQPILRWLEDSRGLPRSVLRVNRIGADLGWKRQGRPAGVPKVRAAVVLPILVEGQASYVQLRTLNGSPPKYLNPTGDVINPRVGFVETAEHFDWPFERRELVVAEGILDALSVAAGGYRAAAVLSASYADPVAARILAGRPERLVVAFDPDPAGRRASEQLVRLLTSMGRAPGVMVLRRGDLNDTLVQSRDWVAELAGRVQHAVAQAGRLPRQSVGRCIA